MASYASSRLRSIQLLLYIISVFASYYFCTTKLHALGFHTRDFPFYLQFGAKIFDASLTNQFSINPYGYNAFGFDGIEGMMGIFHTIHLEPIKLLYGLLYYPFGSPLLIFAIIGLIYFAPPLYFGWHAQNGNWLEGIFAIMISLLYFLFPSSILAVADDLRPYTLLGPFLALTLISIQRDSPRWHSTLFLIAMLSCREEALILATFIIGYALLRSRTPADAIRNGTIFGTIWLLWLLATGIYYTWTAYQINPALNPLGEVIPEVSYLLILCIWAAIAIIYFLLLRFWYTSINSIYQQKLRERIWIQIAFVMLLFVPIFRQVSVTKGRKFDRMSFEDALFSIFKDFMLFPKFTLIFIMGVITLIIIWGTIHKPFVKKLICGGLVLLILACLYLQSVSWMKTPLIWLDRYHQRIEDAKLIWELREKTNKYRSVVLSDLNTYQVFADYEHILVYERLPWAVEPSEARHYPANANRTVQFLKDEVEYVVIAKEEESLNAIPALLVSAQINIDETEENGSYEIFYISR